MQKALGDPELAAVVLAKFYGDMTAVGGRSFACIHGDIKDRASGHAHKLGLGHRRALEMQTPQDPRLTGARVVVLNEVNAWGDLVKEVLPVNLGEKAACVPVAGWRDQARARDVKRLNLHGVSIIVIERTPLADRTASFQTS
jgi:hypothetical protein